MSKFVPLVVVVVGLGMVSACTSTDPGLADAATAQLVTSIDVAPDEVTNISLATFEFSTSIEGATVECQLDGGAAVPCTSPWQVDVAEGAHNVMFTASDLYGRAEENPPVYNWMVDVTTPVAPTVDGPPALDNATTVTFTFTSSDDVVSYQCILDNMPPVPCGESWQIEVGPGDHTLVVIAIDTAGNQSTPTTFTWNVDGSGPVLTLDITSVIDRDVEFAFTATDDNEPVTTTCALDGAEPVDCTSPYTVVNLTDATHTFVVVATDSLSNSSTDSETFTLEFDDCALNNGSCGSVDIATCVDGTDTVECVCELGYVLVEGSCAPAWVQNAYAKASNPDAGDSFGWAVSMSGDGQRFAVGAWNEDGAATGDDPPNTVANSGAVYVFVRNGATWEQEAYLKADNAGIGDNFGGAIGLSGDGSRVVVGAWREDSNATTVNGDGINNSAIDAGAAYVFQRTGSVWAQQAYLKASNSNGSDWYGYDVAIASDGQRVVIGARSEDSADGDNPADNTAGSSGAAYVYAWDGATWIEEGYLKAAFIGAGDQLGYDVAISGDGSRVVAGAWQEDGAATGVNGDPNDNTISNTGAASVFRRDGAVWIAEAYLKASNPRPGDAYGAAVTISGDGLTVAVGAYGEDSNGLSQTDNSAADAGAVYTYNFNGVAWQAGSYVKSAAPGAATYFGTHVDLSYDGTILLVSAQGEASGATSVNGDQTNRDVLGAGAGFIYVYDGANWLQESYLKVSTTDESDLLGAGASMSDDGASVCMSAYGEDSAGSGLGADPLSNTLSSSGAAYVFDRR